MKIRNLLVFSLIILGFWSCQNQASTEESTENIDLHKANTEQIKWYAIGTQIGLQLKQDSGKIDYKYLIKGIEDFVEGADTVITEEQKFEAINTLVKAEQMEKMGINENLIEKNKEEGRKFLEENKNKEGVITTASGMQYTILKPGTGQIPNKKDRIHFQVKAYDINGNEVDNTYNYPEMPRNHVRGLMPGLKEAALMMPVGSIWKVFLSSDLINGDLGIEGKFPPGATIVFEFELVDIVPMPKFDK